MLDIEFGQKKYSFDSELNGFQLAKELKDESNKKIVAIKINDEIKDLATKITQNSKIEFVTSDTEDGLKILRHSSAHLMAYAIKKLFKNVKLAVGPSIENGFYYDMDLDTSISEADFAKIEDQMNLIVKSDEKFICEEWTKKAAIDFFKNSQDLYKVEILNELADTEKITVYKLGDFIDLCRGPHVPSTRYLKYFKLTKLAGAYWKGDSKNKMLQRIYGTAWDTKEKLEEYFAFLEEAEKRDHRKICKIMDLMHLEPDYAPGAPFFHPKGLFIFNTLVKHMRQRQEQNGYIEISTPRIMDRILWEISGHWEHYGAHNYSGKTEDDKQFCIKPMNCPGCILYYKQGLKSYRDLPLRIAEFGKVNRYEASGSLLGLLRVREFTQDDAHIFCTTKQIETECEAMINFLLDTYKTFGFNKVIIKLSTRPESRIGSDDIWDLAEQSLANVLDKMSLDYTVFPGEGAFYGPKLEFVLRDAIGRDWQCGTIQLDMNLPQRFDISYIGEDGKKHQPIMLHRAVFGSLERFMGILIEETEGKFPLWLNPLQIVVATITKEADEYASKLCARLKQEGLRVEFDDSNEKINYKIRNHSLKRVPYIFTIGKKEVENNSINVRILGQDATLNLPQEEVLKRIKNKVATKDTSYSL